MEYFEGAPYRINIEGADSTLVLDSFVRTLKASVVDQDDNIIVDHETKTIYGTLVGNIVDQENNVIFNLEHSVMNVDVITGSIVAGDGSISYNHNTKVFSGEFDGKFTGPLTGNVTGTDQKLLIDCQSNLILGNVRANLLNADNTVAYDNETNTFQGNFVGNFLGSDGNVIISGTKIEVKEINSTLLADDNTVAFDSETNTFQGNFVGNFLDLDGNVVFSSSDPDKISIKTSEDGIAAYDNETNTFQGNFVGNFLDLDGNIILSGNRIDIDEISASLITVDNNVAFDNISGVFNGTFAGTFLNNDGKIIIDGDSSVVNMDISGSVYYNDGSIAVDREFSMLHGSLIGAVLDQNGGIILDSLSSTITIDYLSAKEITMETGIFGNNWLDIHASTLVVKTITTDENEICFGYRDRPTNVDFYTNSISVYQSHKENNQSNSITFSTANQVNSELSNVTPETPLAFFSARGYYNDNYLDAGAIFLIADPDAEKFTDNIESIPTVFGVCLGDGSTLYDDNPGEVHLSNNMLLFNSSGVLSAPIIKTGVHDNTQNISPTKGMIVFNDSVGKFQGYTGTMWVDLH